MKFIAIDGNSLINRAYYGIRPLTTKDGIHTNAIFGFLNTYFKLLEEHKPEKVCVCFDLKAKTFRHLKYDGYKATRKGMPEELAMQMPFIKEVLAAMGVPCLEMEGYEADDLLGTLSAQCEAEGLSCGVVTGDKDSLQLIGEHTRVLIVSTRLGQTTTKTYDEEAFKGEYSGLMPNKIIDLKAIMGDKSDNIPGVAGIGEKGAMELLLKFGSLDGVYENITSSEIKEGMRKKLEEGKEMAYLSYELATIDRAVPIEKTVEQFALTEGEWDKLHQVLARLELFSTIKKMKITGTIKSENPPQKADMAIPSYIFTDALPKLDKVAVTMEGGLFGLSDGVNTYITRNKVEFDRQLAHSQLIIAHHSKPLFKYALHNGITLGKVFDTQIAEYLLSPTDAAYPLDKSLMRRFGHQLMAEDENGQTDLFSDDTPSESLLSETTFFTYKLMEQIQVEMEEKGLSDLFYNIEMPLVPVLAQMEINGILCDTKMLVKLADELTVKMNTLTKEIHEIAGVEFNIGSPKQLGDVLFNQMNLKGGKKTKTGFSTDADALERLKEDSPIIDKILEYRKHSKLKSTYCDGLLKVIDPQGRVHTTFNQMVTATGRLSSQDPNMQNIPIRTEEGASIRKAFVAAPGWVLLDADYSQIELRVLAHISNDSNMIAAFESGLDIHTATAAQVFHVPADQVTAIMRRRAKAVNFGIVYGISAYSLSEDIGVFVSEAQEYINSYFAVYQGVKAYMDSIKEQAKADGFVTTVFGRRRDLPEMKSSNHNIRSFGERVALNMPIQGAAADIMKIAMIRVANRLKQEGLQTKMLLQVHDELVLEAPENEAEKGAQVLKEEMEQAMVLKVKLIAEVHRGNNWLEAK